MGWFAPASSPAIICPLSFSLTMSSTDTLSGSSRITLPVPGRFFSSDNVLARMLLTSGPRLPSESSRAVRTRRTLWRSRVSPEASEAW